MSRLTFFLSVLFISGLIYAQSGRPQILYSNFIQLPSGDSGDVYYTFKIPLNRLVFEKGSDLFLAQYRISVEVFDSSGQRFVTRAIKEKIIQVPDYEQTSSSVIYSEGLLKLDLLPGTYSVMEILYDYKSDRELKLPAYLMSVEPVKNILSPLVVDGSTAECSNRLVLANYGGGLPFDENKYSFIIPVRYAKSDSMSVNVIQNKDTLYKAVITNPIKEKISLGECGGKVIIDTSSGSIAYSLFTITGISNRIKEGGFQIALSEKDETEKQEKFQLGCKWIDKPLSLRNPEMAISALKFIEKDSVISELLSGDEEDYPSKLFEYWKKMDPTPETEFNPLMQEFYTRIDYAVKNFATITGANGANTDRGKVYIRFGKPIDVDRTSDAYGNIIETWTYNNPQRKFVFVDKKGTGDFSLISG